MKNRFSIFVLFSDSLLTFSCFVAIFTMISRAIVFSRSFILGRLSTAPA